MKFSHILAVVFAIGAAAWVLSGNLGDDVPASEGGAEPVPETVIEAPPATSVRVATSVAIPHALELTLTGQTAAERIVALSAQTRGRVEAVEVREGDFVEAGDLIARLAPDDRMERLERARSSVRLREIEYEAASRLAESGWQTEAAEAEALAQLDRARSDLAAIRLDIERTRIKAPISGVLEELDIEEGSVVFTGAADTLGTIVDLDPITVVSFVSETRVGSIGTGIRGMVTLATGETVAGVVRYIARTADEQTRTYRIELDIPNPQHTIRAGMTTLVRLPLATVPSHFLSPSILSLDDSGTLGVKIINGESTVRFLPVTIISAEADGYHVAGLPERVTLITVGHEFVTDGEAVTPVHDDGSSGTL
ncbi:MAG: efflux RND transporter periplasmic adaptor subunit [Alphaproteobacteria bacterium]|nr:efflux RND transporter periplasmic adaptor subunit [Alphaproteobacteria bacterium]